MTTLIGIEAQRFASRRLTRILAGFLVLGFVTAGAVAFAKSNRDIGAAVERARSEALAGYNECVGPSGAKAALCEQPNLEEITADPRLHLADAPAVAEGISALLIILGLAAGASFAGADWHHRVIATTLTWEPRRQRVLVAKVVAVAAVTFAAAVVLELMLVAALTPAAVWRGTTAGVNAAWLGDLFGTVLGGAATAGMAAAIGCAVAMVGRATAAALGLLFAWTAVVENAIRNGIPGWQRWLVADNAGAFVSWDDPQFVRSGLTAGLLLLAYTAFAVLIASRVFARRDVA
ncbi:MAG: hypothetical protein WAT66_13300 [Actinomycetota bacterium]